MKYSVSMSSNKKKSSKRSKRRTGSRREKLSVGKLDRFKKYSGKKKRTTSKQKGFLGIDKNKLRKFGYIAVAVIFFIGCIGVLGVGIYLKNLRSSLPSPDELVERVSDQSTKIYDRNGILLYTVYGDQNREFISIEDVPEHTKWAILAAEDIEFYQHKGLDYAGIAKAALQNMMAGQVVRGGSTLTQQLVKNTILYDVLGDEAYEQTYSRKIKEALITMQVEQSLTKDQILQMYINEVWLGDVNYGFEAGAQVHFGKSTSELTLAESALLAGIISSPSTYSPVYGTNPELAKERQEFVLNQMLKNSKLTGVTEEEIQAAKEEELEFKKQRTDIKAPHFVFYVRNLLEEEYGAEVVRSGGLEVTTSLDYTLQEIAEEEVKKGVESAHRYNLYNGSLVAIDPNNGEVIAMVGSVDYWNTEDPRIDGNVNIATSLRQTGSSAKPYTYLAAITQGYGPWTEAPDLKMTFGNYKPVNWDFKYYGLMTARRALVQSRNLPAVYTLQLAGIDSFINVVEKLGITTMSDKANYGLSLALGSGEMTLLEHTAAFGVFANEGVRVDTTPILKVETSAGEVLYEKKEPVSQRVFDEKQIYALNYMLCDLGGHGDRIGGNAYNVQGKKVCYKTGTTNGPKDVLTMMYHPNLSVGVWGGNNNNEDMPGAWGSIVPLKIVHAFTQRVADQYPVGTFTRPSGILSTKVCTDTGKVAQDGVDCPSEASIYIQGNAPAKDEREIVYICKANGLIAENVEAAKKYDLVGEYILLNNELENRQQQKTYEGYIENIEGSKYLTTKPESGICPLPLGPDNAPVVEITSPTSSQAFEIGKNMTISGTVRVLESVDEFIVSIDGSPISGTSINADDTYSFTYAIPSSMSVGTHTLNVLVKDNKGKTGSASVNFVVTGSTSPVSLTSPANGVNISFPVSLKATVSGTASSVNFYITKSGGGYSKIVPASLNGTNWIADWNDTSGGEGNYTIKARAIVGGTAYDSATVTVTYD
ncbi:MAG: 1A family penicillin-binding protein [candidate division WS6 bacterium 34_10]|uniref:1A family penicillin-binding protein n=1 Tax=candidate division WS6 bacterium 34_10 TaxID=1641389 RepID=A0A101HIH3_9BACT|nr:MAG: 1A family penicillin-binding protein [candidate division WS6 bacterium 34_10]